MKKNTSLLFVFIFLVFLSKTGVFADEKIGTGETHATPPKTIIELNSNIKNLEQERTELDDKWAIFKEENGNISNFVKQDISEEEKDSLSELTYIYRSKKRELDLRLLERVKNLEESEDVKIELLELKKEFYKSISIYVSPEKLDGFLAYIKWDIELNEKNKEVKEELYKEKVILKEKVETIKEKIEEHKKNLDNRIEILIKKRLTEKLTELKTSEKYISLSTENKVLLFQKTLEKTVSKRKDLEALENRTNVIEKRIEIYFIVEDALHQEIELLQ